MPLLKIKAPITVRNATLVLAVSGWVDAGSAASSAAAALTRQGRTVAVFDADEIYDYRSVRPEVDFAGDGATEVRWPSLSLTAVSHESVDLLVLSGTEPNLKWRTIASELAGFAATVEIGRVISLGAVPAAVPHTRPTPIMVTSNDPDIPPTGLPEGTFTVPGAIVNVIGHQIRREAKTTDVGFWAQIPHYVSGEYWPGAVALLQRVSATLGLQVDLADMSRTAAEQRSRLDAATSERPEARAYVRRLEENSTGAINPMSADQLGEEIEEFLRTLGDEDNPFE